MTETQLYNYSEALADIAYEAGFYRLRINENSRTIISTIIQWAKEFQEKHQATNWEEVEYLDTIYSFIEEKLGQHMYNLESNCPECPSKNLRYEIIREPHEDEQYRVVCRDCGKVLEGETAKDFLSDTTYEIYWNELRDQGKEKYDIESFLRQTLTISDGLYSKDNLILHFEEWKEQDDLEFEKIQDANYYSQL